MEIRNYLSLKKNLYIFVLNYLENTVDCEDDFGHIMHFLEKQKYIENHEEFRHFLLLMKSISNNHHKSHDFMKKIESIILNLRNEIEQTFSKFELLEIFENNKYILNFLFEQRIIVFDESIYNFIIEKQKIYGKQYCHFFLPEIKQFIKNEEILKIDSAIVVDDFEEKRKIGENDSYLSSLIREDSVEEFISYVNLKKYSLSSSIKPSIFETNQFLIENEKTTLIEYAAFFGSIQIFQFLKLSNAELTSNLWLYAINSKNAELIHLLEECHVEPDDKSYEKCFIESIKCHHNDIANYIHDNLLALNQPTEKFCDDFYSCPFHYMNYLYFPENLDENFAFFYLCKYNYSILVNLLINEKKDAIEKNVMNQISIEIFK